MDLFEYEVTRHPADAFKHVVYFCSEDGKCGLGEIPSHQIETLENILNDRGRLGWELVNVNFGKDGILVFWKRMINGMGAKIGNVEIG